MPIKLLSRLKTFGNLYIVLFCCLTLPAHALLWPVVTHYDVESIGHIVAYWELHDLPNTPKQTYTQNQHWGLGVMFEDGTVAQYSLGVNRDQWDEQSVKWLVEDSGQSGSQLMILEDQKPLCVSYFGVSYNSHDGSKAVGLNDARPSGNMCQPVPPPNMQCSFETANTDLSFGSAIVGKEMTAKTSIKVSCTTESSITIKRQSASPSSPVTGPITMKLDGKDDTAQKYKIKEPQLITITGQTTASKPGPLEASVVYALYID